MQHIELRVLKSLFIHGYVRFLLKGDGDHHRVIFGNMEPDMLGAMNSLVAGLHMTAILNNRREVGKTRGRFRSGAAVTNFRLQRRN